jgi:hypothetical protein
MERFDNARFVHGLVFFVVMLSMKFSTIANVTIQDFDDHLADAKTVLTGMVKQGRQGHFILVVESSLKGAAKPNEEIIVDETSGLAWRHFSGGGPMMPTNYDDFIQQIQHAEWYGKRAVFLGSIKDGKWSSHRYDWSVWTSGASTYRRNEALSDPLKSLSFEELVEMIKSKLGDSTATDRVKRANHDAMVSSEEPDSRMAWNIIVAGVMAAMGLLWLVLKRRS